MYQGVLRDDERRRRKMKEREEDFLKSQQKREVYERAQRVESIVPLPESDSNG
jgi:protein PET117